MMYHKYVENVHVQMCNSLRNGIDILVPGAVLRQMNVAYYVIQQQKVGLRATQTYARARRRLQKFSTLF